VGERYFWKCSKKKLKADLEVMRSLPGRVGPSHAEIKTSERLVELFHREEIMWRQRSRIEWLSAGYKNTKFFHQRASMRRRKNLIKTLTCADGRITEEKRGDAEYGLQFLQNLYTSEGGQNTNEVLDHVPRKANTEMNAILTAPYEPAEVKTALFQMFPTKAPGSDGFPAHFFKRHWDVCGEEVTDTSQTYL
jgi:hypothetical protein